MLDIGLTLKENIMNPDIVTDIRKINNPFGMTTNSGTNHLTPKSTVKGRGHDWYDPIQVSNIFVFSSFKGKHRMAYDHDK